MSAGAEREAVCSMSLAQNTAQPRSLPREFSFEAADRIWERDKGVCVYCGKRGQQVDHVVPRKLNGPAISANGVLACQRCNYKKGKSLEVKWLTIAFTHLLTCGEDLGWLNDAGINLKL